MSTTTKLSSELVTGDIVLTHGMRVELLTKTAYPATPEAAALGHDTAYSHVGRVLNIAEVDAAGVVPISWRTEDRPQFAGTPNASEVPGDRWTVQGNDLVRWEVEA